MAVKDPHATLSYAVRGRVVAKYLGQLALVLAALSLVPLGVALYYGDHSILLRQLIVILVLTGAGLLPARMPAPAQLQANEALVVTALAFVLGSLVAVWPMMSTGLSFLDAWFEAISGITTTGLSTLATVADKPHTFLFMRAWMQWYGGLGIVILSVALLVHHQHASRRLVESAGVENIVTTTRVHARRMLAVYGLLTLLGVILIRLAGAEGFSAVTHGLSAISTGGFSMYDRSIAALGSDSARSVTMLVALCGAISLPVYYRLYQRHWREVTGDPELWGLLIACLLVAALLALFMAVHDGLPLLRVLPNALWMGLSAQTTTGFSSMPVQELDSATRLTLIVSMLIGGSVGSTAGGVKILRLLVLLRLVQLTLRRTAMPAHAVAEPWLGGHRLEADDLVRGLLTLLLFGLVVILSWLPFVAWGYAPLDALFEVVSATATVGLSTGISHAGLAAPLKLILMADMLLGRLEIVALLVVLFPGTWIGRRD